MKLGRREFINTILGLAGSGAFASVVLPVFRFIIPPKVRSPKVTSLNAGKLADFPSKSSKILRYGRIPIILVRSESDAISALAATCTHLDCIVQYQAERKQILCACHNGRYDLKGRNISGPPPKPLAEFNVSIIDGDIVITEKQAQA